MALWINTRQRYGLVAQALHWLVALMIGLLLVGGLLMTNLPTDSSAAVAFKSQVYSWHKTLGSLLLLLALFRVGWALATPRPAAIAGGKAWQHALAQAIHYSLYVAIIAMPLLGWLQHSASLAPSPVLWPLGQRLPGVPQSTALAQWFGLLHGWLAWVIIASLALHIAGALKHALIDRDATLQRMIPGMRPPLRAADLFAPQPHPRAKLRRWTWLPATALALTGVLLVIGGLVRLSSAPAPEQTAATVNSSASDIARGIASDTVGDIIPQWQVIADQSRLGISVDSTSGPVSGVFGQWRADIRFDPDDLTDAAVDVRIATGSLDLGYQTAQAVGPAFLASEAFPEAQYRADRIEQQGPNRYLARGRLTLLGVEQPLDLPFQLVIADNRADMTAEVLVNRLDWGVGAAGFADASAVGFPVTVRVALVAQRIAR